MIVMMMARTPSLNTSSRLVLIRASWPVSGRNTSDAGRSPHNRRVSNDVAATLDEALSGPGGWTRKRVYGGAGQGGSQGAELWADASGRLVIVKHHPRASLDVFEAIGRRIQALRDAGVPAPATTVAAHGPDVLLLHGYLPGRADPMLTSPLIDDLIDIVGRQAGLADDSAEHWPELIRTRLTVGHRHDSLQEYSAASGEVLRRVERVGQDSSIGELRAPDLVHYDLHTVNVLSDDDRRVSGIIDWDGVRAGDRSLDLANLAFTSTWRRPTTNVGSSSGTPSCPAVPMTRASLTSTSSHSDRWTGSSSTRRSPPGRREPSNSRLGLLRTRSKADSRRHQRLMVPSRVVLTNSD